MDHADTKAELQPVHLCIALLPAIVFIVSLSVLQIFGGPIEVPPARLAEYNVHAEGAARITTLAALMLFLGTSVAALIFFFYTLRMLAVRGRAMMIAAFLGLSLAAVLVQTASHGRNAEHYIGLSFACLATGYTKEQSDQARSREKAKAPAAAQGQQPPAQSWRRGRALAPRLARRAMPLSALQAAPVADADPGGPDDPGFFGFGVRRHLLPGQAAA